MYKIIRFYQNTPRRQPHHLPTGLTLEEAQKHCSLESTHGEDWFDGYTKETIEE